MSRLREGNGGQGLIAAALAVAVALGLAAFDHANLVL
jgi:hypothetical protein